MDSFLGQYRQALTCSRGGAYGLLRGVRSAWFSVLSVDTDNMVCGCRADTEAGTVHAQIQV